MLDWQNDKIAILRRISERPATLKIVLKTLDDPFLIRKWVMHHAKIVALENIIIADNGSSNAEVLSFYEEISDEAVIFRFDGFHNFIHDRSRFPELYDAIRRSARHVTTLDTDELLISCDGESWRANSSVVETIRALEPKTALLTTWLYNDAFSDRIFKIADAPLALKNNALWGKPIVPSDFAEPGLFIHNVQFPPAIFDDAPALQFFLLHLTRYSREQRLHTNRNKLAVRNFVTRDTPFEEIAARAPVKSPDITVVRCVDEIVELLRMDDAQPACDARNLPPNRLRLMEDGAVAFSTENDRFAFQEFVRNAGVEVRELIAQAHEKWRPAG